MRTEVENIILERMSTKEMKAVFVLEIARTIIFRGIVLSQERIVIFLVQRISITAHTLKMVKMIQVCRNQMM